MRLNNFINTKIITVDNIFSKNPIGIFLISLISVFLLLLLYLGLVTHPAPDTNYYMSVARDIMDGYTPTVDVATSYTPFVFYILALFLYVFGNSYSVAVFAEFLFSLANVVLLYHLLSRRLLISKLLVLFFLVIYTFSLFQLTAFYVLLEPFQVFFALLSIIFVSKFERSIIDILIAGILMGFSVMCKQYSLLFAVGVGLWMILDVIKKEKKIKIFLIEVIVWSSSLLIPYFLFIALTKATLMNSLKSFGFVGSVATNYAAIIPSFFELGFVGMFKVLLLHFFDFMPFVIYPIYRFNNKRKNKITQFTDGIFLIGMVSFSAIYVRQYAHYFQLLIPWAIVLWLYLLNAYIEHKRANKKRRTIKKHLILGLFLLTLPSMLYMSPKLFYFHFKTNVIDKTGYRINFTKEALSIFPDGSQVYVCGNSLLYVSCNYRNPLHNYSFESPAELIANNQIPENLELLIIPKLPKDLYVKHKEFFLKQGYKILADKEYGLYLKRN